MSKGLFNTINDFISHLKMERNFSANTQKEYSHDLLKLMTFILTKYKGKDILVNNITTQDIRDFVNDMQINRKCRSAIISRRISCLRSFFGYLIEEEILKDNPMLAIRRPKQPKRLPIYLTEDELKSFLGAPDQKKPDGIRDFCILMVFSYTGMRISELCNLQLKDINLNEGTIRVIGKGNKERIIPIIKPVIESINNYLDIRPMVDNDFLYISKKKNQLSLRAIRDIVYKYQLISGIHIQHFSPHKLRHTFATMLHNKDVDILDIQALLGHSSIATTQIYTHTNPKR
jgi:site-specific recombinase XerD